MCVSSHTGVGGQEGSGVVERVQERKRERCHVYIERECIKMGRDKIKGLSMLTVSSWCEYADMNSSYQTCKKSCQPPVR